MISLHLALPLTIPEPTRLNAIYALHHGLAISPAERALLRPGDVQVEGGTLVLTESTSAALGVLGRVQRAARGWSYVCEIAARLKVPRCVVVDALDLAGAEAADDGSGRRLWRVAQ